MHTLSRKNSGKFPFYTSFKTAGAAAVVLIFAALFGFNNFSITAAATAPAVSTSTTSSLQGQINANDQQIAILNQEIATYQAELQQIGSDKRTLQQAINALDLQRRELEAQVYLTQRQINTTQLQIQQLGGAISNTQQTIVMDEAALAEELRNMQEKDSQPLIEQLLSAGGLQQAVSDVNTIMEIQQGIQGNIQSLAAQKDSLTTSQDLSKQKQTSLSTQKTQLVTQQQSLVATEQAKTQLLAETNAKQSTYEKLLAEAQAELASFSTFTQNAGGSKLLGNQTVCDSWGCYYNQRDTAWGNDSLNGTKYNLASDGCLITAMAMMMTHYGYRDVTPITINSNPSNFAAYYPAYLLFTIHADGVSATRISTYINSTLATGNPVVVGLHAYGGTHYVVLVARQGSGYIMKDPYVANGNDIPFTSHYSMREIFGVTKVVVK